MTSTTKPKAIWTVEDHSGNKELRHMEPCERQMGSRYLNKEQWIEFSAYGVKCLEYAQLQAKVDSLERENAKLRADVEKWQAQCETDFAALEREVLAQRQLREQVNQAKEALEFYGKVFNYDNCMRKDLRTYVPANSEGTSEIETDRGKRARTILTKLRELDTQKGET